MQRVSRTKELPPSASSDVIRREWEQRHSGNYGRHNPIGHLRRDSDHGPNPTRHEETYVASATLGNTRELTRRHQLQNSLQSGHRPTLLRTESAWRWPPTPSSAKVKERVELYLYSPSGPSCPILEWTLHLPPHPRLHAVNCKSSPYKILVIHVPENMDKTHRIAIRISIPIIHTHTPKSAYN